MRAQKRKEGFHESPPRSGVWAERRWLLFPRIAALCRDAATPGFMAPARACKIVGTLDEPSLTPSLSSSGGEGGRRPGDGDRTGFMVPRRDSGVRLVESPSSTPRAV